MFRIYPYKMGSASVKKLKTALEAKVIKVANSAYRPQDSHLIINWGNSNRPTNLADIAIFNEPEDVAVASNKLLALRKLCEHGVPTIPFTSEQALAEDWTRGGFVFARTILNSHSGNGIVVCHDLGGQPLPNARLYTKGVTNNGEYRVHVFDGDVILYQKKSRKLDDDGNVITADGEDALVRNLASNWIYRTGHLERLERIEALAIQAVNALGLDFGAVDIIKDGDGNVFVLEVNTAPGLGNESTLEAYVEAFKSLT